MLFGGSAIAKIVPDVGFWVAPIFMSPQKI
jgi:hypothetical protein